MNVFEQITGSRTFEVNACHIMVISSIIIMNGLVPDTSAMQQSRIFKDVVSERNLGAETS